MRLQSGRFGWLAVMLVGMSAGCASEPQADRGGSSPEAEKAVRQKFSEVQSAIRAKDAARLWALLSSKSRTDAEKEAAAIRTAYEKGSPEAKTELEKQVGLGGAKMSKLTGAGFLGSKVFLDKRGEVADGVVTQVTAQKDSATVYFFDERDDEKEKLVLVLEDGQWKAWMAIPKYKKR